MARQAEYKLVPKAVPTRRRTGFYENMVEEFMSSKEKSVLIDGTDRKPATLVQGLRKVLKTQAGDSVKVVQRGSETYLVKS